jgi:hypothetical protein
MRGDRGLFHQAGISSQQNLTGRAKGANGDLMNRTPLDVLRL